MYSSIDILHTFVHIEIRKEMKMTPRDKAIKDLKNAGYIFDRHGANHDIYWNKELNRKIPLKRHDFDEHDRAYINKEIRKNQQG